MSMQCITLNKEFKDFKDHFQNSRTFQGSSKTLLEIQGLFKDFKDQHENFKNFFHGCGNPGTTIVLTMMLYPFELQSKSLTDD